MNTRIRWSVILLLVGGGMACGQKGPLFLPSELVINDRQQPAADNQPKLSDDQQSATTSDDQ